ncbi:hypothetical protein BREU_3002 [Bifidobacterium reuteri DSM 23975]|uniref:Uncharacterized protein n=1 Tax=Bifidobacterium reuteri DSM 23975 TaxID=1437610 RepID=A0A087CPU3_9BIFI|nr:hypothetical protein BREU_3002 [Bifidobacterium reuteri DSM 23975]
MYVRDHLVKPRTYSRFPAAGHPPARGYEAYARV